MSETPTPTETPDGGGAAPVDGGGPFDGVPGLEQASQQLNRVREMLQKQLGEMVQSAQGAMDGIGNALRNLGGGGGADSAPGMVADPETAMQVADFISQLPGVLG